VGFSRTQFVLAARRRTDWSEGIRLGPYVSVETNIVDDPLRPKGLRDPHDQYRYVRYFATLGSHVTATGRYGNGTLMHRASRICLRGSIAAGRA
jgi:hypothetical protein